MPHVNISTTEAARLAKRLTNHFRHKVEVTETDTGYLVKMAGADVILSPKDDELYIEYTRNTATDNPERPYDEGRLRHVITDHLDRMANQNFVYDWQD